MTVTCWSCGNLLREDIGSAAFAKWHSYRARFWVRSHDGPRSVCRDCYYQMPAGMRLSRNSPIVRAVRRW